MSMDYNWEPKGAPGSNWLDDDLGDVMGLLDKDYAPASNPAGLNFHIPEEDGGDDLDYIKFILEKDSVRNQPLQQPARQWSDPARPSASSGDDLDDIMGLLDRDYSKPQPVPAPAPVKAAPARSAAPQPRPAPMPMAEPSHQGVPRTEAADDLSDILGLLDRDYTKPEAPKAARAPHKGGLEDMDFIPGFDDFPDVEWDDPAPKAGKPSAMKANPPKGGHKAAPSKAPRNPYPVKSDPPTAVRQGKDKLLPVLLGTAAAQVVAIAVVWVLWLL